MRSIILPISRRLGTALGSTLSTFGVASDDVSLIVAAVPAVLGIAFDLAYSNWAAFRGFK